MDTIVVTESTTSAISGRSLHNRIAWRHVDGQLVIVAVGSPEEWHSPAALPPSAITTDLVAVSTEDPGLAQRLWGAFLGYLVRPQVPSWYFVLPRFLRPKVSVSIKLPKGPVRSAVSSAIGGAHGPLRFKVGVSV